MFWSDVVNKLRQVPPERHIAIGIHVFLLGYILAFLENYRQLGLYAVVWHTHIMFLVIFWVIGYYILGWVLKRKKQKLRNTLFRYSLFVIGLLIFEVFILLFGPDIRDRRHYWAPYNSRAAKYYHRWPPNSEHFLKNSEFSFARKTNSLGFPDQEWNRTKLKGEFRILCLGDSFTEGDGAHQDSSYVAFLRRFIKDESENISLMNAGVCGSDPFINFVNLRDTLISFRPDLIIQTLSFNDITTDFFVRGGMERFLEKGEPGKVQFRKGPWWEPLYAMNYSMRLVFRALGYNYQLLDREQVKELSIAANKAFKSLFREYDILARQSGAKVCLVLLPMKENVAFDGPRSTGYDFVPITQFVRDSTDFLVIDLYPMYDKYVYDRSFSVTDIYWQYDGHHNARGYQMMAELILDGIRPILPLPQE